MCNIIPFKATRPTADKVSLITCRSYEDYNPTELASQLEFNPYSFLHVLNPAYLNTQKSSTEKRFKTVALKYHDFKNEGFFITEEKACFYIYEIRNKHQVYTGIIGGSSVEDYKKGNIKKHEDTLSYRVDLFKDYLHHTQFNTEPVLITYPDQTEINTWIEHKKHEKSIYHFSTANKELHTIWKVDSDKEIRWLQDAFKKIPEMYIADGHHRSASAELLWDQYHSTHKNDSINFYMSYFIPESNVKIYEYNRLIHDLNGWEKKDFFEALEKEFKVTNKGLELWTPQKKHEFGLYIDGVFYALELRKTPTNFSTPLSSLDAQILYEKVLNPLLNIQDLRNDDRIEYIAGKQSIMNIKQLVDEGEFRLGFFLYPTSIDELKTIADKELIMPPKSTYIEPKFRSGLLIYEL